MSDAEDKSGFSPPYNVAWSTFITTVEKVATELPNRVDRYYLDNQSGSTQTYLISAFKGFGLIHDDSTVDDSLKRMADPEGRKAAMAFLLSVYYPKAVALGSTNATDGELNEAFAQMFPSVTGESRVKAIRFFLFAAEYAEVPRSPLWKKAKSGASTGTRKKGPKRPGGGGAGDSGGNGGGAAGAGGGQVTLAPTDPAAMKAKYFDLLLKKAESSDDLDPDLLNRIEKLIDVGEI